MRYACVMLAACLLLGGTASAQEVTKEQASEKWVPLFNGTDLTGFTDVLDNSSDWQVVNGVLEGRGGGRGQPAVLATDKQDYANYKLRIVYGCQKPGGGGIELRRSGEGTTTNCYMVANSITGHGMAADYPAGNVVKLRNYTYGVTRFPPARSSARLPAAVARWHLMEITVNGNTVSTTLNGQPADKFTDGKKPTASGGIGLFVFGDAVVQFKEVSILELP
jgi:hypothetical protein